MAQIKTPLGYIDITTLSVGDSVSAYDESTGIGVTNTVDTIELVDESTYSTYIANVLVNNQYTLNENDTVVRNGEPWLVKYVEIGDTLTIDGEYVIVELLDRDTDNQVYVPDVMTAYVINGSFTLCKYQSVYVNGAIAHASEIKIGDVLKDDVFGDITVTSISETTVSNWYRLSVSGNHAYILDGVLVHNASRFWVGGNGTWNAVNTTNWSSTSGGSGGSSVPTSADDVTFDSLSNATAYAVTFAGAATIANNLSISGPLTGNLTITNTSNTIQVFGNSFLAATGLVWTTGGSSAISFLATSGTKTIRSNGNYINGTLTINGVGGTFQLLDDYPGGNIAGGSGSITLTNGTFDPNGFTMNVSISNNFSTITGAWNFYNLTFNPSPVAGLSTFSLASNISVANIINIKGNNASNFRVIIQSTVVGTPRTITLSGSATGQNADLQDITGAGSGTWDLSAITGGSSDCGGNTGITFTAPTTVTATGTAGFGWSTHAWSGRSFPLAQDTVSIPNAFTAGQTVTIDCPRAGGNIIFSCTGSPTLTSGFGFGSGFKTFGSWDLTGVGSVGTMLTHTLGGRGSYYLAMPGGVSLKTTVIDAPGGTYTMNSGMSFASPFSLNNGTINDNSQAVTFTTFTCATTTAGITRALTMSGTWTSASNAATIWNTSVASALTINCTGSLQLTYAGATGTRSISNLVASNTSAININATAGSDILNLSSSIIKNLNFTGFSGSWSNSAVSIMNDLTVVSGMTVGAGSSTVSFLGTANQNITSATKNFDFPITINGFGVTMLDALSIGTSTDRTLTLSAGTLVLNGFNLTHFGQFSSLFAVARTLSLGSSTYNLTSTSAITVFDYVGSNLTITGNGTIKISGSTTNVRTLNGNGATFPTVWYSNATANGTLNISGQNTYSVLKYNDSTAQTIAFTNGTTHILSSASGFQINGTAGNLVTLNTISGSSTFTLSCAYNNVACNYLNVSNSIATGGARWFAGSNSTRGSGNKGWRFVQASSRQGSVGSALAF